MTTIQSLRLMAEGNASLTSEETYAYLTRAAAELSALQQVNNTLRSKDNKWRETNDTLRTRISGLERALRTVLASAHPHPMEHGAMYEAWQDAKKALALQPEK